MPQDSSKFNQDKNDFKWWNFFAIQYIHHVGKHYWLNIFQTLKLSKIFNKYYAQTKKNPSFSP